MLPVGQECKAGLCCYAGVRYKNTTRHFQSSNAGRAPAPPPRSRQTGSAAQGPAPGPRRWALQRLWWVSSHRRQPRQSAPGAAEGPLCPAPHSPRRGTAGDPWGGNAMGKAPVLQAPGRRWGGELLTGSHAASCRLFHFCSLHQTKPATTTGRL